MSNRCPRCGATAQPYDEVPTESGMKSLYDCLGCGNVFPEDA